MSDKSVPPSSNNEATSATKYPPGVILGPDGKPCKPCNAFRTWAKTTKKSQDGSSSSSVSSSPSTTSVTTVSTTATTDVDPILLRPADCPPDSEQLGRATWTFLHTTAAYYPTNPSPTQKSSMLSLLRSLPHLYPCSYCADHLKDNMKVHPPDNVVSGPGPLSKWLCDRHNDVNFRLGKPIFDCAKTDERWKDGPPDGSCD
ncbi:hypothetical protein FRC03_005715 [Tulasnella sp. 419]|nr:hypothetical protein FRC03_005715 [Tulasnella sp. 419]